MKGADASLTATRVRLAKSGSKPERSANSAVVVGLQPEFLQGHDMVLRGIPAPYNLLRSHGVGFSLSPSSRGPNYKQMKFKRGCMSRFGLRIYTYGARMLTESGC